MQHTHSPIRLIFLPSIKIMILLSILFFTFLNSAILTAQSIDSIVAQSYENPVISVQQLTPNTIQKDSLHLSNKTTLWFKRYQFAVPHDAYGVYIYIENAQSDLDLIILDKTGQILKKIETNKYNEKISLNRLLRPQIHAENYYVDVIYQFNEYPFVKNERSDTIDYQIGFKLITLDNVQTLTLDTMHNDYLLPDNAMAQLYKIHIPKSQRSYRVDILDAEADIDMYINNQIFKDPQNAYIASNSYRARESAIVSENPYYKVSDSIQYIMIVAQSNDKTTSQFKLRVGSNSVLPANISPFPSLPIPQSPLQRALISTVSILSGINVGSGILINEHGYIMTNAHVIMKENGKPSQNITISLTLDATVPPKELFSAHVLDYDKQKDIALLQIHSDIYNRPIPPTYQFPYIEFADISKIQIGDKLQFIGYPANGGFGSRASITYTTGVVSGFVRQDFGTIIKTDGKTNSGSSGGAALTENFLLVGMPTQVARLDTGQLAYIHPINILPNKWLTSIFSHKKLASSMTNSNNKKYIKQK